MVKHIRWYVNVSKWKPTKDEWLKLTSSIGSDEVERINKFVYQDDAKSSLVGCALIRKFLCLATELPSNEFVLRRTKYGRPEFVNNTKCGRLIDFNVSHSGDYCVLAGVYCPDSAYNHVKSLRVGVDVTKIVKKATKQDLDRFLDLMSRREFTRDEWDTVEQAESDRQKCINFTRLWCLKESFIKAVGLGLSFKLRRIDFRFPDVVRYQLSTNSLNDAMLDSTRVLLDDQEVQDWLFYETALDDDHLVALAYNIEAQNSLSQAIDFLNVQPGGLFVELFVQSIVESLTPILEPSEKNWILFMSRGNKTRH